MPAGGDKVPMPTNLNEESPDLDFGIGPAFSMRQAGTIVVGFIIWVFLGYVIIGKLLNSILGITPFAGLIVLVAIPIFAGVIAFKKKNGFPYEYYLANKLIRMTDGDRYVLQQRETTDLSQLKMFDEIESDY